MCFVCGKGGILDKRYHGYGMHKPCFRAIEAKHRTLKEIGVYPHPMFIRTLKPKRLKHLFIFRLRHPCLICGATSSIHVWECVLPLKVPLRTFYRKPELSQRRRTTMTDDDDDGADDGTDGRTKCRRSSSTAVLEFRLHFIRKYLMMHRVIIYKLKFHKCFQLYQTWGRRES